MADLELTLSWLGMTQYYDRFVQAGFDSWEVILEITEDDLEILNVDLGHRRKLQREIANSKALAQDPAFVTPLHASAVGQLEAQVSYQTDAAADLGPRKRGYRHHPKPDPHAPERPYSAYVMFSNDVREHLKNDTLSFTEISRQVGLRWQALNPQQKEYWRQKAAGPWDKYKADFAKYQQTDRYQEYLQYLSEFKAAQATKKSNRSQRSSQIMPLLNSTPGQPSTTSSTDAHSHLTEPRGMGPPAATSHMKRPRESKVSGNETKKNLKVGDDSYGEGVSRHRSKQACESCRQKKIRCSGERPVCSPCRDFELDCCYESGKLDQEQKRIADLTRKLNAYENIIVQFVPRLDDDDQLAVQKAINMLPQPEHRRVPPPTRLSQSLGLSNSDRRDGELSEKSDVGSIGSTIHVNEDDFAAQNTESHSRAFVGPASDIKWTQQLEKILDWEDDRQGSGANDPQPSTARSKSGQHSQPFTEEMDAAIVGDQVDPFGMPVKATADILVNAYFHSVHPSFPVLEKPLFMHKYKKMFYQNDPEAFSDRVFVATLQLVFAIGAVYGHLTGAEWVGDTRDHVLYFAQARIVAVDTGILNDVAYQGQVQVFSLGAMYLFVTDQVNRAWNMSGLSIRCAQSLGFHLQNVTSSTTTATKTARARIWFSLITLERTIAVMTGRPSMVNVQDCSVVMPDASTENLSTLPGSFEQSRPSSSIGLDTRAASVGSLSAGSSDSIEASYFKHYIELTALAQDAVAELYSPGIRKFKWSKVQAKIDEFDQRLCHWQSSLDHSFKGANQPRDKGIQSYSVALKVLFHSTRSIINRPCLYRLDRQSVDRSDDSHRLQTDAVKKCVNSGRAVLALIITKPSSTILNHGTTWWMRLHYCKRALTVLLLELAYRAEHMPSEADALLAEASKAIDWLSTIGASSSTARRTWKTMFQLFQLAARHVGAPDVPIASAPPAPSTMSISNTPIRQPQAPHLIAPQPPPVPLPPPPPLNPFNATFDPNAFPPLDLYGNELYSHSHYLRDLAARSDFDQFRLLSAAQPHDGVGASAFPPMPADLVPQGQVRGEPEDIEQHDYVMGDLFDF